MIIIMSDIYVDPYFFYFLIIIIITVYYRESLFSYSFIDSVWSATVSKVKNVSNFWCQMRNMWVQEEFNPFRYSRPELEK